MKNPGVVIPDAMTAIRSLNCDTTRSTVEFSDGNRIQTVRHERADDGKTYSPP